MSFLVLTTLHFLFRYLPMTIHKRLTACQGLAYGWSLIETLLTIQASNVVVGLTEMFRTRTSGFGLNHPNSRASLAMPALHFVWMQLATPVWACAPYRFHLFWCFHVEYYTHTHTHTHTHTNFIPFFRCAGPDVSGPDDLINSCRFLCEDCSSRCTICSILMAYCWLLQNPLIFVD